MKKTRLFFRLLGGYGKTYWRSFALALGLLGVLGLLHRLGGGTFREVSYALLLMGVILALAALVSFLGYARRRLLVWQALEHLPPEPQSLPQAHTPLEEGFRALALAYGEQFRKQTDQARRLENERTDYYTLWVHQVKTPIAALNLMAQSETPVDRELLRQEIYKIEQYADAALSFQRLESMSSDLVLTQVDLYPLCCQVVKRLRPLFSYRRIRLAMEPFACQALSDAKWLGLVLEQVLTNALKYQGEGGLVTVSLASPQVLTIADRGIGIRAEDVPRVFERGFTGYTGRSGEKSTGIGLYLCRQACLGLGHRISLTSRQGEGTTVTLDMRRESFEAF